MNRSRKKAYLSLSWIIGTATNPEEVALSQILSLILVGNEAAPPPVRRLLIQTRCGSRPTLLPALLDLPPSFISFSRGVKPDRAEAFTQLVPDTLTRISDSEIDGEKVEAAFQQATYHYQEVASMFPLRMLYRVIDGWIYEKDSDTFLKMGKTLADVRQQWQENPSIFNDFIREKFIENPHRLTNILSPDRDMQAKMDAELAERMKETRAALNG